MELSEQAKKAIESEVASHEGKKLVRLLKFMRNDKPMLQMAFDDGTTKEVRTSTFEGRDYLFLKMKEKYWWNFNKS